MSTTGTFRIGDVIRIIRIPSVVLQDAPAETRRVFKRALGNTFVVRDFDGYGHIELDVSKVERSNTIWIEPECLQLFRRRPTRRNRE